MSIDRRRYESGNLPLRAAMERLFEGSVINPHTLYEEQAGSGGFPPADLFVTENDVVICLAVPGAGPDDLNVSLTGDAVSIGGRVQHQHQQVQAEGEQHQGRMQRQTYFQEIWSGTFQRSFTLPVQVDAGKAEASFEHGILTLTLPKSEATKPRKIQVQSRHGSASSISNDGGSEAGQGEEPEIIPVQTD